MDTELSAAVAPETGPRRRAYLTFMLGDEAFGLAFARVTEVRPLRTAMPVLAPPDYATGFVLRRGRHVPVVDLRVHFGRRAGFTAHTRLIVARSRDDTCLGLLVDRVDDVLSIHDGAIFAPPDSAPPAARAWLLGTMPCAQGVRRLLDLDRMF